jgi:carbon-monoxide dehydrogenase large subunit
MMVDIAARRIGIDALELRRRNVLGADDMPYTNAGGLRYEAVTPAETLERAAALIDYDDFRREQNAARAAGRYVGIGLGLYVEPSGAAFEWLATEAATIRVLPGGLVQVAIGAVSHGQSVETTIAQVVAEHLGVAFGDVFVVQSDSAATPYGGGTQGSRTAVNFGSAARLAAEGMRAKILAIAAEAMEAAIDDLQMQDGIVTVKGMPSRQLSLHEVARLAYTAPAALPQDIGPGLEITARYEGPLFTFSNACHACVCEVDPETAKVTILRYVVSEDCGPMINPMVVDGQIDGGVVQGIGGVLYEHMVYDEAGNPLTTTLADYLLPTATEVPLIIHDHVATAAPGNRSGFKGMGEGGVIGATPAIANAVADALAPFGSLTRLPFGPRQLFDLIHP